MSKRNAEWAVEAPTHGGRYFEQCGWKVVRKTDGYVVYSGDERGARQWARDLNRRVAAEA